MSEGRTEKNELRIEGLMTPLGLSGIHSDVTWLQNQLSVSLAF